MTDSTANEKLMLDAADVARMLAVSTRTIWRLLSGNRFPKPVRIGRSVRWDRKKIEAWIADGCPEVE